MIDSKDWRMRHMYLILDEGAGMRPLTLRAEQDQFLRERHNRNFVPKARKLGMSTVIVLDYLDTCLFGKNISVGHIDLSDKDAHDKLQIARFAWENGPAHPDPEIAEIWRRIHKINPLVTDASGELEWTNGSRQTAGVSYTGKTPQKLHISEYGPIAAQFPDKAGKIKRGSMNAVPPNGTVDIETTMEGGKFGECYEVFRLAVDSVKMDALRTEGGAGLSPLDWRLHFFPWWNHPSYVLPGRKPYNAATVEYAEKLRLNHKLVLPADRWAWYEAKRREQGDKIFQQFPTVIEECDRSAIAGQIYPELTALRVKGRIRAFEPELGVPLFTFWDLNVYSTGWLIQQTHKDINALDWTADDANGAANMAKLMRAWEVTHGPIAGHFLPHDAASTEKGSGKSFKAQLIEAGIPAHLIHVVPRTPDVWRGIEEVRRVIPNLWFHSRCDEQVILEDETKLPSAIGRLEGYRRRPISSNGVIPRDPLPDICSHTADAFRTFAEARSLGMVRASLASGKAAPLKVTTGFRGNPSPASGGHKPKFTIRR
jgi:hypothetical protein